MPSVKRKHRGPDRVKGRKGEYPVGTVRIRHGEGSRGQQRCRYIKVSMVGRPQQRWIPYARFVWEATKGPIPRGKILLRLDGDMMNDDIANLALGTHGDVVGLAHLRDPKMSDKNYAKLRRATAKSNRERAVDRRAVEWLPASWYAVFPDVGQVWNEPRRKRTDVLRLCGIVEPWRTARSAALGFAGVDLLGACILLVGEAETFEDLCGRVNEIREFAGWMPATRGAIRGAVSRLRKAGLLERGRGGYRSTGMEDVERARKTPVFVIRGDRLRDDPQFQDLKKVWQVDGVCVRCGCHEHDACVDERGPCWWAAPGLCSACSQGETT